MPKPLTPVASRPFLYWVTSRLVGQGVTDLVYSAGYLGEQIESWLRELQMPERIRAVCRRDPAPLGTGGAVLACLDICQDLVLVVNGDTLLLAELAPAVYRFQSERLDGLIAAVSVADASRFGSLELDDDRFLRSFHEKRPGAGLVNGGIYLFAKAVLEGLPVRPSSIELDLVPMLIANGARIGVQALDGPLLDIGVPETLARADEFVATHRAQLDGLAP